MAEPTDSTDHEPDAPEVAAPRRERSMGFLDHLEELRWTLVKCAIVFVVFAALIGIFLRNFNEMLLWPLHMVQAGRPDFAPVELGTVSVMETFSVILQMCFLGALVMGGPFMLFFVGQFIAPALHEREMKLFLPGCIAAFLLFLLGCAFSFFLLAPATIRVSLELNELLGFTQRWTPGNYYSLLMWLVLGVGTAFEFPLIILLLVYLEVVSVAKLRSWRRHAIIVFFVVAAIVTPTPDPFVQTSLAIPLYGLYEIAMFAGARLEKRRAAAELSEQ